MVKQTRAHTTKAVLGAYLEETIFVPCHTPTSFLTEGTSITEKRSVFQKILKGYLQSSRETILILTSLVWIHFLEVPEKWKQILSNDKVLLILPLPAASMETAREAEVMWVWDRGETGPGLTESSLPKHYLIGWDGPLYSTLSPKSSPITRVLFPLSFSLVLGKTGPAGITTQVSELPETNLFRKWGGSGHADWG